MKYLASALLVVCLIASAVADTTARTVQYHAKDIIAIRAKVKYTTLIELPASEKIIEAATGDKDFWIIDVVQNFCFLHPAKSGIRSNVDLVTDKGNIYSFTLEEVTDEKTDPDLKVIIQPVDQSSLANLNGPAHFVPASEVDAMRAQAQLSQAQAAQQVEKYRSEYPTQLKFDYRFKSDAPFNITSMYHDDRFTYVKSEATEKFAVYEIKDGSPNFINYELRDGTYVIAKVLDHGYLEIGKKRMGFTRKEEK
ncbi:MAG TPA: TrbG/VirB9 family P-type conjugative transfer protein [Candidatus Angelobacter sp.]|nr:TrbG/VirB9 family P-type conjugative transfer protein [Candidatus Angelobacter sp.]